MSGRVIIGGESIPRLVPHAKLRFDRARDTWTIQAPERTFMLDAIAHAVVSRCDGAATLAAIVDDLCRTFEGAPRDVIEGDVMKLVQDFADKQVMTA